MLRLSSRTGAWLVSVTVVAGTAAGLSLAFIGHETSPPLKTQATPGTTSVTPRWLPSGVVGAVFKGTAQQADEQFPVPPNQDPAKPKLEGKGCAPFGPGCGAGAVYVVQGSSPRNTRNPNPISPDLRITFRPGQYRPLVASSARGFVVRKVTVRGFAGILVYTNVLLGPGAGTVRLDWVDPRGLHSISTERGDSPAGLFDVSDADLLKMANSLYG